MNTEKNISNTCSINISQQNFPDHKKDKGQERERDGEFLPLSLPLIPPPRSSLPFPLLSCSDWLSCMGQLKTFTRFFVGGLPLLSSPGLLRLCLINWKHNFMKENSFLIFSLFDGLPNWSFEMPELNCTLCSAQKTKRKKRGNWKMPLGVLKPI